MQKREKRLAQNIGVYLQTQYKDVIFRFDTGADMKLTIGQARSIQRLHGAKNKGYPDLFIAKSMNGYHGLYIELKSENIYLKDGSLSKSKHIQIQNDRLTELRNEGYYAEFSVGFDKTKILIDNYMKGRIK